MDSYYDIAALSASGINSYLNDSPLHYWTESPFNPNRIIRETTPAMLFGKVAHKLALEADLFFDEFTVAPEINRRTNAGKDEWTAFCEANAHKTVITAELYAEAQLLGNAMREDKVVQKLLGNGMPEKPVTWKDECGMPCKAKLDYYRQGLILDYKTSQSASPAKFTRSISDYGYHRQAAWYMDAIEKTHGERPKGFVFIVQDKSMPGAISKLAIDQEAIEIGAMENERAMTEIAQRLDNGNWNAFPEMILTISLPTYYKR